jgi:ABC-type tungstate transport system substrate-binding protein
MANFWNNVLMVPAAELIATMDGTTKFIGTLLHNPVKLILDNQSVASVVLYISLRGTGPLVAWHTFPGGEAMIIDDDIYTLPIGTSFYGVGASGEFSISYFYTQQ